MKNLLKLPVLLLAVMLVASCGGDSKKEEEKKMTPVEQAAADGERICAWECEMAAAKKAGDMEAGKKLDNEEKALMSKYGPEGSASDEEKEAFSKGAKDAMKMCKC